MTDFLTNQGTRLIATEKQLQQKDNHGSNIIPNQPTAETLLNFGILAVFISVALYCYVNRDKIAFESAMDVQGGNVYKRRARAIVEHVFKSDAHAKVEDTLRGNDITAQTLQFNGSGNTICAITIDKNFLQLRTSQLNLQQMLQAVETMNRRLTALNQMEEVQFLRTSYGVFNLVGIIEDSQGFEVKRYIISLNTIELKQMLIKASELYTQKPLPSKNLLEGSLNEPFNPGEWTL
jgi:hypothetical protein